MFLTEAIARAYCGAGIPVADNFFAVGTLAVGRPWHPSLYEPAGFNEILKQAQRIGGGAHAPWMPAGVLEAVENDAFTPRSEVQDGRLRVWVPVATTEPISSTVIHQDWRFVGLIWWVVKKMKLGHLESGVCIAFDASGRQVAAEFRPAEILAVFDAVVAAVVPVRNGIEAGINDGVDYKPAAEVVSGQCLHCLRAPKCHTWLEFSEAYAPIKASGREDDAQKAVRLLSARTMLGLKAKPLDNQKMALDKELGKLVQGGRIRLGPDEDMEVPVRKTVAWDFGAVYRVLSARGIWENTLGEIRGREMNALYQTLPADVQKELEPARTEKVGQPSISEGVRHARFGQPQAGTPAFAGVSGKGQKTMGSR